MSERRRRLAGGAGQEDEELGAALGAGRAEADTIPVLERVAGLRTFSPLTKVPVALPASSIARPAGVKTTRAWKGSTLPSMIWTPASMLDPTIDSPPVRGRG